MQVIQYPGNVSVIRGIFSDAQTENLFSVCDDVIKKSKPISANHGCVLNMLFDEAPNLRKKFLDPKLVEQLSKISQCDPSELRITRHSDYHINTIGNWHTDLDMGYCTSDEAEEAGIFKFGIFAADKAYLHKIGTQFRTQFGKFRPKLQKNDILIFPVGIEHRGYCGKFVTRLVKFFLKSLDLGSQNINKYLYPLLGEPHRKAIFFTFGRDSVALHKFESNNIARAEMQNNT
ncbi:MAG: hypothetical protein P8O79_14340 [Halieaceae bacterium]|nr:hypothetical protein [Halieaceae bacterium]